MTVPAFPEGEETLWHPVLAFDVNETLLDLCELDPVFAEVRGDPGLRPQWFASMVQLAVVGGLTGRYVDVTTAR